jgi:hypothetical protein
MLKYENQISDRKILSQPEWLQVHKYLDSATRTLGKSKSEKKIPKFSVINKLDEPENMQDKNREFNTLEKEIKEWEVLAHMKETNKKMFRQFVNQKKRQEDIDRWLFEQGIKQSLIDEKKMQLKNMLDANSIYPFHPNLTKSSKNIMKRIRLEEDMKKGRFRREKNKTFNEKTNGGMIFNTRIKEIEELEDSWDFTMKMNLNTTDLKSDVLNPRKTMIKSDFLNLMASKKLGKSIKQYVNKKQNQLGFSKKKRKKKARSAPRKTMYLKGRRQRQVENKLLNLIGQSRLPETKKKLKNQNKNLMSILKTIPVPVPNRGTIIQKTSHKFK